MIIFKRINCIKSIFVYAMQMRKPFSLELYINMDTEQLTIN